MRYVFMRRSGAPKLIAYDVKISSADKLIKSLFLPYIAHKDKNIYQSVCYLDVPTKLN